MPKFETVRSVKHSPQQMFDLVADIRKYPEFLPLCERLEVRSEQEKDGKTLLVADMTVAYKMVRETFASQVYLRPGEREIDVKYIEGPFRYLDNRWVFEPTNGNRTNVRFFIDYEFRNRMFGVLMGAMFDTAFRRFAAAFEERADKIYGSSAATAPAV